MDDERTPTFPSVALETERLLLRPYRPRDAAEVLDACRDELIQRWLPLPNPYTEADATTWCTELAPQARETGEGIQFVAIGMAIAWSDRSA